MEVVRQAVILNESTVFCLVLSYNTVSTVVDSLGKMDRFSVPHIFGAVGLNDGRWNPQANSSLDTALTTIVMLVIGLQGIHLVAQHKLISQARELASSRVNLPYFSRLGNALVLRLLMWGPVEKVMCAILHRRILIFFRVTCACRTYPSLRKDSLNCNDLTKDSFTFMRNSTE